MATKEARIPLSGIHLRALNAAVKEMKLSRTEVLEWLIEEVSECSGSDAANLMFDVLQGAGGQEEEEP